MDKEEQETGTFDIRQILEEIKTYSKVPKENILEFILQDKKDDTAFFYYKNMLLQLLELDEHFDAILGYFDGKLAYRQDSQPFLHKTLNSFVQGDTQQLREVIEFAAQVSELSKDDSKWDEIKRLTEERIGISREKGWIEGDLRQKQEEKKEKDEEIEEIDTKESGLHGIQHFFKKRQLHQQKSKLQGERSSIERESETLEQEQAAISQQLEEKTQEIKDVFASFGMPDVGERFIDNFSYLQPHIVLDEYQWRVPSKFREFQDDVYSMTQLMGCLSDCVRGMDEGMSLESICTKIREQMASSKIRTNGTPLEVGVRKKDLPNAEDNILAGMSSKSETLGEDFGNLSAQFQEALSEKDETEFIKKSADFHFDFIRVHPFSDANGRTSRILMSMMLATRNYMLPSLYSTMYDKETFYNRSDAALQGDYSLIEQDVFARLGHFYPLVMPRIEKGNQGKQKSATAQEEVTIDDIAEISEGVDAQERREGVQGMKSLEQEAQIEHNEAETEKD